MSVTTEKKEKVKFSKAFWVANTVELLERGKGVRIHLYCFFESPDGKRFSNSQYIKL